MIEFILVVIVGICYVLVCPFTKVEESFNCQAIHDLLNHGADLESYDHNTFPGVVPRTFLGAVSVALVSKIPVFAIGRNDSSFVSLICVRLAILGILLVGLYRFVNSVRQSFGRGVAIWFCLIVTSQFHLLFYLSRPLPNIFALFFVLTSLAELISRIGQPSKIEAAPLLAVFLATLGVFVFRFELVLIFGPFFISHFICYPNHIIPSVKCGVLTAICSVGLSVLIDSVFWNRWLYPEGEVLWYNTVENKSKDWGTSPFLWYFYSALPRSLGSSYLLAPLAVLVDRRMVRIFVPVLVFVLLYSVLPHKELRFVIYAVPFFNICAAAFADRMWRNRAKGWFIRLLSTGCCLHLVANLAMTVVLAYCSFWNYPGGYAVHELNQYHSNLMRSKGLDLTAVPVSRVHIDVFTAQSGLSRFLHSCPGLVYDKSENMTSHDIISAKYDYLAVGKDGGWNGATEELEISEFFEFYDIIHRERGFNGVNIEQVRRFPFVRLKFGMVDKVLVLKRKVMDYS